MSAHADLLARLLPPTSYTPTAPRIRAELKAEGRALDTALDAADTVADAVTPFFAHQLLPDWERVCGITPPLEATVQQRVATVVAKINETGGLSIPYFVHLAKRLGYAITIDEPQPFRVDASRIGDTLYAEDIIYQWEVIVQGPPKLSYYFRVDQSVIGERLLSFADPILEQVFIDLKPAHTFVYFAYLES
jgi:uncharacterized protein YmfQ (DUF2313 family)